jgi:hypothetical protein
VTEAAPVPPTPEDLRLAEARDRGVPWRRWGPYLSERQWGTVREDYSAGGDAWDDFGHDQARMRAYRWGEDGIAGLSDDSQHLCFAIALWNGADPILKERLFGLTNAEGNHGEDAKEVWFHLDNLPTHAYMKTLYKYPQRAFPYAQLVEENRRRTRAEPEYELLDTGIFDDDRYFDVFVEYAKAAPDDLLIRISAANRGPDAAVLHLLPTLWFRNDWSWKPGKPRPRITVEGDGVLLARHRKLGTMRLHHQACDALLFTENESNAPKLWGVAGGGFYKDAFDDFVVRGRRDAVNPALEGSKASPYARREVAAGETWVVKLRLAGAGADPMGDPLGPGFDAVFEQRRAEADAFYRRVTPFEMPDDLRLVQRQAFAGLLWSKQWYHYDVRRWLKGDPVSPPPPQSRRFGRNHAWTHFDASDVISMPDKWEYPWFAAWDLAFHCVAFALIDAEFAKQQLLLLTREWYMHPNGQLPAYEWNFGDVNPPVHAWAAIRVYQIEQKMTGRADRLFLERIFQKLLINFTWWVNRKDEQGNNLFEGGFLGLDNIGAFDRSAALPGGGRLEQVDGTAWMAMYCLNLLAIALELAKDNPVYEDVATKFFEHFVYIGEALNRLGGGADGLWDEDEGWYFDALHGPDGSRRAVRAITIAGLVPVLAVAVADPATLKGFRDFESRRAWFTEHRPELLRHITDLGHRGVRDRLRLALVDSGKLARLLERAADPEQLMSPHGLRSVSRRLAGAPFVFDLGGVRFTLGYEPGESTSAMFGGNSNWRGPVWFPTSFLMIESLRKLGKAYGPTLGVEVPGLPPMTVGEIAEQLANRLIRLFVRGEDGRRPIHGASKKFQDDPHWRDYVLFYEHFHGDTGMGLGASHQTGWTGLVASLIDEWRR